MRTLLPGEYDPATFFKDVVGLRGMWGERTFWQAGRADRALAGLTFVYLNTKATTKEDEELVRSTFLATVDEFSRRQAHAMLSGLAAIAKAKVQP